MAWTAPKTYTVGELLTASDMNLYQRDNFEAVLPYGVTWQTYTPQLTAVTTNPTLGSGSTQAGRYYRIGQLVHVEFFIQFGTSGTAAGSGTYEVSVPISMASSYSNANDLGSGRARVGGTRYVLAATWNGSATKVAFYTDQLGVVAAGTPGAWGVDDRLTASLTYEAA